MSATKRRGLGREAYARIYETNAPRLRTRKRLAWLVIVGNGAVGVALVLGGALSNGRAVIAIGALFVVVAIAFGAYVASRVTDRMLLIHARVLRARPAEDVDDDPTLDLEIVHQMRMRPDGRSRSDPPKRVRCTLSVSDEVWREVGLVPDNWPDVRLLAMSDGFVFSTLGSAKRRASIGATDPL